MIKNWSNVVSGVFSLNRQYFSITFKWKNEIVKNKLCTAFTLFYCNGTNNVHNKTATYFFC